jgi:hypothetical protein
VALLNLIQDQWIRMGGGWGVDPPAIRGDRDARVFGAGDFRGRVFGEFCDHRVGVSLGTVCQGAHDLRNAAIGSVSFERVGHRSNLRGRGP